MVGYATRTEECPSHLQSDGLTVLRPLLDFAPSYFDDIFTHSRASDGLTDVEVQLQHLRKVFETMRKLYANPKECIFCTPGISVLGCYVNAEGVRANQRKLRRFVPYQCPGTPRSSDRGSVSRITSTGIRETMLS